MIASAFSRISISRKAGLRKKQVSENNTSFSFDLQDKPMFIFLVKKTGLSGTKCDCFQARLLASVPEYVVFRQVASGTTSDELVSIMKKTGVRHGVLYRKDDVVPGDFIPMASVGRLPSAVF